MNEKEQKNEQVLAYLKDVYRQNPHQLTCRDVESFFDEHGVPEFLYQSEPGVRDALYCVEENGVYTVYEQEREMKCDVATFSSKEDAEKYLAKTILARLPRLE